MTTTPDRTGGSLCNVRRTLKRDKLTRREIARWNPHYRTNR